MTFKKWKNHSLVTDKDITFHANMGLPIEVFCMKCYKTLAFGKVEFVNHNKVSVNGRSFDRQSVAFFG
ncbi:hypothetical protein LGQ02_08345 [Bacillus shivajii]|uniref:hypothetical protein n=1 Tax=Bacillus shivajii TaxID=1983719 RepID=UPI001CF93677|nr:hypothetical protein [Bacillus shivajii]UCZ54740.1 hypothetical protein LGQ02_08345 [Bacillus shivajii]